MHTGGINQPHPNARAAFTVMELLISVLVLGIMAAVAAPRYVTSLHRFRVDASAKQIVADIDTARRLARTTGVTRTITFDVGQNRYTLLGIVDADRKTADSVVPLAASGYSSELVSANFDGTAELSFDLYGRPLSGPTKAKLATGEVVIRSGSLERTVVVDHDTGRASVL